jgi:hypothetical protein
MSTTQPRACSRCMFIEVQPPKPPNLTGLMICRRDPPQMSQMLTQQGIVSMVNFPTVAPDTWCYQFREASEHESYSPIVPAKR